jgi:hypothetical protein
VGCVPLWQKIVDLLLKYDANVFAINGEGRTAGHLAADGDAKVLIETMQRAAEKMRENTFLGACKDADFDLMKQLVSNRDHFLTLRKCRKKGIYCHF